MQCDIRLALALKYRQRVEKYDEAVRRLKAGLHAPPPNDPLLWEQANQALDACLESQREMERHTTAHGCHVDGQSAPFWATA